MSYRSKIAAISTALLGAVVLVPAALAIDDTNVTVTSGTLTMANPTAANFTAVTLNGSAQTTTAVLNTFSATDARGSGLGWNITVVASRFTEHDGTAYIATTPKTLPTSSLTLPVLTATPTAGSGTAPTMSGGVIDSGTALKFATAAATGGAGMGTFDFTANSLSLSVPANTYALAVGRTYRSDVTFTIATGP